MGGRNKLLAVADFPIVVLASGSGSNLQAILDRFHGGGESEDAEGRADATGTQTAGAGARVEGLKVEVVGVGSDKPGAYALKRASAAGVATAVFSTGDYADRAARDRALGDWIESTGARLVVLAGYMQLLSVEFVQRFYGRLINVHPSLLPSFPGLDAIGQALNYGVAVTGVTVHFVDDGMDTGPIIAQRAVPVPADRDRDDLEAAIHAVEHELLPEVIGWIANGRVRLDGGRTVAVDPL